MATAGDLINVAFRLLGVVGSGETASSEDSADALTALNDMIDSWNTERLSVYSTQDQTFTWPASTATRSLGPTGDFVGNRPVMLDDSTYFKDTSNNLSFNIIIINQDQYDGIALKTATSSYPQYIWLNSDMPNLGMTLWPIPNKALEWHFISVTEITQPATLATSLSVPPGYRRAFTYNLAVEIASFFGLQAPPQVVRIANAAKKTIKRINNPLDVMAMPYTIAQTGQRFNIFTGSS